MNLLAPYPLKGCHLSVQIPNKPTTQKFATTEVSLSLHKTRKKSEWYCSACKFLNKIFSA